jgi:hypothetical protein
MKALLQVVMLCDISPASPRAIPPFLILHFDFARSDPTHTTILRCQNQIMARLHSVETLSAPLVSHIGDHFLTLTPSYQLWTYFLLKKIEDLLSTFTSTARSFKQVMSTARRSTLGRPHLIFRRRSASLFTFMTLQIWLLKRMKESIRPTLFWRALSGVWVFILVGMIHQRKG